MVPSLDSHGEMLWKAQLLVSVFSITFQLLSQSYLLFGGFFFLETVLRHSVRRQWIFLIQYLVVGLPRDKSRGCKGQELRSEF